MIIFDVIWLLLPAAFANMFATVSAKLFPRANFPLDFNRTFRGKRIFGLSKTFRGLIFGVGIGSLVFIAQQWLDNQYDFVRQLSLIDYQSSSWLIGLLLSAGGLMGDALKSFIKRQLNIAPGQPWVPFDYIDWIVGSLIVTLFVVSLPLIIIILAIVIGAILHPTIKYISYLLRLDKKPY